MIDKLWNATYWSKRLQETTEEAAPLLTKLNNIPFEPLTYEERWLLQSTLQAYASYSHLLADDMAQPDPAPKSFLKRLFNK